MNWRSRKTNPNVGRAQGHEGPHQGPHGRRPRWADVSDEAVADAAAAPSGSDPAESSQGPAKPGSMEAELPNLLTDRGARNGGGGKWKAKPKPKNGWNGYGNGYGKRWKWNSSSY